MGRGTHDRDWQGRESENMLLGEKSKFTHHHLLGSRFYFSKQHNFENGRFLGPQHKKK